MVQYITTLSKYFTAVIMLLYTLECFLVFKYKEEHSRKSIYISQLIMIVLVHFACFLSIILKTGEVRYLIFYAILQIFILGVIEILPMVYPRLNRLLINNACMLISIGLIMLVRLNYRFAVKQFIIVVVSFAICAFIPFLMKKIKRIPNIPLAYAGVGIVALAIVFFAGSISGGSKLSISIFGVYFMPSEFVKVLFVIFVSGALCYSIKIKNLVLTTAIAALHIIILAASNDLGAALVYYVVFVVLVFIATQNYLYLSIGTLTGVGIAIAGYNIFRHVRVRVAAFIDPFSVIDNEGYQITQSLFALSSGSWFGVGLFNGTPDSIPYVETDLIFSAIVQELGIVFAVCLVLICLSCFIMFINISFKFDDSFYKLISIGLGFVYVIQVFLTIGGGTKFIPLTGVTLPFVSHGGSSVMATLMAFFVIEGMYVVRPQTVDASSKEQLLPSGRHRNNIILVLTYLVIASFMALCTYLCVYSATHKEELFNNSYNPMQEVVIAQTRRGTIYSRNNVILAETRVDRRTGEEKRYYPFFNIFSHAVGYSTNGRAGIEGTANYYLINTNQPIGERMAADLTGNKYIGDGVISTLDENLQKIAYTALGTYKGAVVVSNPKTGEILAMVSKPDFDPNEIDDIWNDLLNDKNSSVLLNRATQGLYPPGSTFKIVTLLEYIRENPDTYLKYSFNCSGVLNLKEGSISCYNHQVHGHLNLKSSFAKSCNSSFGNIGLSLDRDSFEKTLESLMFNSELPLTMNYSESAAHASKDYDDITMVRTAFGQGDTLMSPMHLNMITSSIANDGVLMKPYLISEVVNSNMNTVKAFEPEEYKRLMSSEEASILTEMMRAVVTDGTGKRLNTDKYTVAGKTGSAEFSSNSSSTHSWFTGFAPIDDPQICVTIILEDAGSGNLYATPMAKKIFDEFFRNTEEEEYLEED